MNDIRAQLLATIDERLRNRKRTRPSPEEVPSKLEVLMDVPEIDSLDMIDEESERDLMLWLAEHVNCPPSLL